MAAPRCPACNAALPTAAAAPPPPPAGGATLEAIFRPKWRRQLNQKAAKGTVHLHRWSREKHRGFQDAYPKQRWIFYINFSQFIWRMIFRLNVNSRRADYSFIEFFFDHWVFSIWWSITGDLLHHLVRSCYTSWPAIWLYDFLCLMPCAISWTILHAIHSHESTPIPTIYWGHELRHHLMI